MESPVVRFLIAFCLFILLTGDMPTIFGQLFTFFGISSPIKGNRGSSSSQPSIADEPSLPDSVSTEESLEFIASHTRSKLSSIIKNYCLPKLICELNSSHKEHLSDSERNLLALIRDTTMSTTAEVTSKYHYAAHMGQLIADVDGTGCHNFFPGCPFPGVYVLNMMKKVTNTW